MKTYFPLLAPVVLGAALHGNTPSPQDSASRVLREPFYGKHERPPHPLDCHPAPVNNGIAINECIIDGPKDPQQDDRVHKALAETHQSIDPSQAANDGWYFPLDAKKNVEFADPHSDDPTTDPAPTCFKGMPCVPAGLPSCEDFHAAKGTAFHSEKRDVAINGPKGDDSWPPVFTPNPWLGPVCMKEYKFLFYTYHIAIPHGALYCARNSHCGSGFWDNIRPHQATGWGCRNIERDSLYIHFNVPLGISDHTIADAVYRASAGKVAVFCEPGTQQDAKIRWEAAKNRPLNVHPNGRPLTEEEINKSILEKHLGPGIKGMPPLKGGWNPDREARQGQKGQFLTINVT